MRRFIIIVVIIAASMSAARQPIWLLEKGIALTLNLLTLTVYPRIAAVCQFSFFPEPQPKTANLSQEALLLSLLDAGAGKI